MIPHRDGKGASAAKWLLDLKKGGTPSLAKITGAAKADMTLTVKDDDMIALAQGQLNPQSAFMQGKIKIKGNMGVAMKLDAVNQAVKKLADSQPKSAVVFARFLFATQTTIIISMHCFRILNTHTSPQQFSFARRPWARPSRTRALSS